MSNGVLLKPPAEVLQLPMDVDWYELIEQIRHRGNLPTIKAAAHAARINPIVCYELTESLSSNPRYQNSAALINLYWRLRPGADIPIRKP